MAVLDGVPINSTRHVRMTDFQYTIKAHPTTYAGVNFRSRLEATWAAFFDIVGWKWDYEPIDLDGWVPDFILDKRIAVEIKPIFELSDLPDGYLGKIKTSGWKGHIWVLGNQIDAKGNSSIGWSLDQGSVLWPQQQNLLEHRGGDFVAFGDILVQVDYMTDGAGGAYGLLEDAWAMAKNITQWKRT